MQPLPAPTGIDQAVEEKDPNWREDGDTGNDEIAAAHPST